MRRLLSFGLLSAAALLAVPVFAAENIAAPASGDQKADPGVIVPPSVPRAAQIEPMVAPVKRSAPQMPASAVKIEKIEKSDKAGADKSKNASAGKSATCDLGKKRGERCVTVAADEEPARNSKKK